MQSSKTISCVIKFGGTSVKTPQAIRHVHSVASSHQNLKVIVVSAVGGVTNMLVELCNCPPEARLPQINNIKELHLQLARDLGVDCTFQIHSEIKNIELTLNKDHLNNQDTDQIIGIGEILSSIVISAYLNKMNLKVEWLDARSIIRTDSNFGKARPDTKAIGQLAARQIDPTATYITQGFIGANEQGLPTTLGRGGSDYSAALFAEAIGANELFIYTDVPGVYTMDPNIAPNAKPIANLTFSEMAEMANFGAKVLHPATLEPCATASIPVIIKSTFAPHLPGTTVRVGSATRESQRFRAITLRKSQILVTIRSLKMINAYGYMAEIFSILSRYKISVDLITTSEASVALTIDGTNLGSHGTNPFTNQDLINELQQFAEIKTETNLTLVAIIGSDLTAPGIIQEITALLKGRRIRMLCYGASKSNIGLLVNADEAASIASHLHQHLIEGA